MSVYRTRNQTVLAKIEAVSGEDALPVPATDAVLVEAPTSSPNLETVDTAEVTGALDSRPRIPAGGNRPFTCVVYLKGSGTPGVAPEYGPLLRACGMSEQLLAADETAAPAAADATTVTLAGAASAVDDFYRGMVIGMTGGAAGGQSRVIASYDGTTKVATVYPAFLPAADGTETAYTIYACALYKPASVSLATATIYQYKHRSDGGFSQLVATVGAAGTFTLDMPVRQPGRINFSLQGQLVSPTDVAHPGAAVYNAVRPRPYLGAQTYLGAGPVKLNTLNFDLGAGVNLIDNPAQEFGYDAAGITERRVSGRFNPPMELQSVRNGFNSWLNGVESQFWNQWGGVAGNRVSLYNPGIVYTGVEDEDVNGFGHEGLPFDAVEENAGIFMCLY